MNVGSSGGEGDQDFELNLASIIDCFTVLITYLLVSASFITLGILDVTVASNAPADEQPIPPEVSVTIALDPNRNLIVKTEGAESNTVNIGQKSGEWDFERMTGQLKAIKDKFPKID